MHVEAYLITALHMTCFLSSLCYTRTHCVVDLSLIRSSVTASALFNLLFTSSGAIEAHLTALNFFSHIHSHIAIAFLKRKLVYFLLPKTFKSCRSDSSVVNLRKVEPLEAFVRRRASTALSVSRLLECNGSGVCSQCDRFEFNPSSGWLFLWS